MCEKQRTDTEERLNPGAYVGGEGGALPGRPYGNPVGGAGEVLAGEYRPDAKRMEMERELQAHSRNNMRLRDGSSEKAMSGSARAVHEANRELANQCSAASLVDHATRVVKESVHSQRRVQQAVEYLDLAARYPDIARMIELSRNGLY